MIQRPRMRILKYYFLLFILFSFVPIRSEERVNPMQATIVSIDSTYTIHFGELDTYVRDILYDKLYRKNREEGYNKALEKLILNKLKIIDFFDRGLDENKESFQGARRTINEELVVKYFNTQFRGKPVDDQSIQKVYRTMEREIVYQQILLLKPKNISVKQADHLKLLAHEIKTKVDKGVDFAEIRKTYSSVVVPSNSNTLTMDWKISLAGTVNSVIFTLPAGESRLLEDKLAYYIVKVAKTYTKEVSSFEKVKDEIRRTMEERLADQNMQEYDSTKESLINEKTAKWNRKGLQQLLKWSNIPAFYLRYYEDTLQNAISQGRNFMILRHSKGSVDLKEFLRLVDEVLTFGNYGVLKENNIKTFILEAVRTNLIVEKAKKLDLEKEVVNSRTTNQIIKSEIVRLYNQQVIESQIPPATQSALQQFYNENKDSLYYQLAKINVYAIITSEKDSISKLQAKLRQNIPFEKLTNRMFVKTFIRNRDGIIKSYFSEEKPYLGEAAFKLKLSEIAGPIEYADSANRIHYALIKCIAVREEKQLTYNDAEKTIGDDYRKYYREKFSKATEEQLKKKYTVKIYEDILQTILLSLGIRHQ